MNTTETQAMNLGYTAVALDSIAKRDVPAEMRLARIIRKASAKDSNGLASMGVHLPVIAHPMEWLQHQTMMDYVAQCLMDVQDKMVRAITDNGRNIITDSDIDAAALVEYLESNDENIGRLSKDKITQWFTAEMQDTLMVAFADKLGVSDTPTPDEEKKIAQACAGYKDVFSTLAAKQPSVDPKIGERLLAALDMIPASAFSLRIRNITEKAMKQPKIDLLAL